MRLRFLVYVLCLYGLTCEAQVVFCPPGAVWKSVFTKSSFNSPVEMEIAQYTGTMVLANETVAVITHQRFFLETNFKIAESSYLKQIGDTIFVKNSRTSNVWQILYNYAALAGNTWTNTLMHGSKTINYTTTVNSVQNTIVNGFALKQLIASQVFDSGLPNSFTHTITERLGSNRFLFSFGGRSVSDGDRLIKNLCYDDNVFGNYTYDGVNCEYPWTGTENIVRGNKELIIYPNPVTEILNVDFETPEDGEIKINDVLGKEVFRTRLGRINVSHLSKGIYFLNVYQSHRLLGTHKLIKE